MQSRKAIHFRARRQQVEIKRIRVDIAGKPGGYAKSTAVTGARGYVWLSGCVGMHFETGEIPEGAATQAKLAMKNIKARLEEAGTSLENIVFMQRYVVGNFPNGIYSDPTYQEGDKALQEFWAENCPQLTRANTPPPATLIGVSGLSRPGLLLEIDIVAALP